jgi:hypothetical protein
MNNKRKKMEKRKGGSSYQGVWYQWEREERIKG